MTQRILNASENYAELDAYLRETGAEQVLLVCDSALPFLRISGYFDALERRLGVKVVRFDRFQPNPLYESAVEGVRLFREESCDLIIAVGGGSAMDVAKCIKLYAHMDPGINYLEQKIVPNDIPLLAVPTTAGTGSEATRYAVVYYKGEKQSVCDESCIPSAVLMDASVLKTLPAYQKKATMMDAFCHALESFWSVNSTQESKAFAREAIRMILENKDRYLANDDGGNAAMLKAANLAGRAINITQTTAGHAMCYKLTSLYGIAHGHAAALCVGALWPYMTAHAEECVDPRGKGYLRSVFGEIADAMGCTDAQAAIARFQAFLTDREMTPPERKGEGELQLLKTSVNPVRLKNNPVRLDEGALETLYRRILAID